MGDFSSTVQSLFKGMDGFLTTKTVVGDAVKFDDGTIILPLVDVSFGVAAGAFSEPGKKETVQVEPNAILVIKDGQSKLVNVKNQDGITKILDMVPELIDKYGKKKKNRDAEEDYGYEDYEEDYDEEDYAEGEEEQAAFI